MGGEKELKITHVYVRSKDHSWEPALQLTVDGNKAKIARPVVNNEQEMLSCGRQGKQKYHENEIIDLNEYPNKVLPMQNVDANGNLESYKDMVELPFMHEAAILYNLKHRHVNQRPYTRTGDILIAVNPYQWFHELYTERKRNYYSNRLVWEQSDQDARGTMESHVYEVSALSYKGLAYEGEDQSILVSGESGAGKTETVKICLNHVATTQRGQVPEGYFEDAEFDPVVQRVVQSNPLLEAFGNAKTRRNDNSSRFGKYLQLQFDKNAHSELGIKSARCGLVGSSCEVYLLEKNRVIDHDHEERTFHIFYQMLAAPAGEKAKYWSKLATATKESFKYVGATKTDSIEGKTDAEHYAETIKALNLVNVDGHKLEGLMKAICIVMQLGNIGFAADGNDADKSVVSTTAELAELSNMMGIPTADLTSALTERTFKTKKETHKVPLNAAGAKEACDSLAKESYQKAFLWLVKNINQATCATSDDEDKKFGIIGMLDIFGFEHFDHNRYEQLCINYANEKLQQKFTEDIFRNVQAEYKAEGIPLEEIWYDDNTDVLDLIEGPTGLLNMLNEECIRPKGNDLEFVQKALQQNKNSPCLIVNKLDRLSFAINHYAGEVMYDAENFVSKNLDTLPTDLQECAERCDNFIIKQPRSEPTVRRNKRQESNIAAPTVWSKYKGQLNTLMKDLRKTRSRYIRCIKPNSSKAPELMEHDLVVDQLRCAGVVAGITISRSCFPNRLENMVVLSRYSGMWDRKNYPSVKTSGMTIEEQRAADCKALMTGALRPRELYENGRVIRAFVVGKTKTYFRAGALEWLESNRMHGLDAQAVTIQRAARGWLARNSGNGAKRRKAFEEEQRRAREAMEREHKQKLAREAMERAEARKRENHGLRDELDSLQQALLNSDKDRAARVEAANERCRDIRRECTNLKEQFEIAHKKNTLEPKRLLAQQQKKLEESTKLIGFLKKENKKVRKEHEHVKSKHDQYYQVTKDLESSNSALGEQFDSLNDVTARENMTHEDFVATLDNTKAENKSLKTDVMKMQDEYMEQAEGRLQLQKTMAKMLTIIQEHCKDRDVVEDTVVVALECETEAKSTMAALEMETSDEPSLELSDVSESDHSQYAQY